MIVDFGISYIKKLVASKTEFRANSSRAVIKVGEHLSNQYILLGSALREAGGLARCTALLNSFIECTDAVT